MQTHEYYEELCALLPIGQLSAEEYQQLSQHLKGCASCRDTTDEFSVILDKMPVGDAVVDEKSLAAMQSDSYRSRFLQRALAEGVPLTNAVVHRRYSFPKWTWPRLQFGPGLAAVAVTVIVIISIRAFRSSEKIADVSQRIVQSDRTPPIPGSRDEQLISQLQAKVSALEKQNAQQQSAVLDLKGRFSQSQAASNVVNQELANTADHLSQVQKQASEAKRALDEAKADLDRVRSEKDRGDAALVDQQIKINELVAQVKEKEAVADRERQLSSVTKDVRELMGARNLHIVDVSDVDGNGRSGKSFGRVFLIEGKSLIFYAFDLGDRGNPAKVSFQAWGQFEGRELAPKNLGVFYIDDHAQKRWVLKVDDPEKLAAINSLFVTVEPLGGAKRPSGKRLLYAYLASQPNHP